MLVRYSSVRLGHRVFHDFQNVGLLILDDQKAIGPRWDPYPSMTNMDSNWQHTLSVADDVRAVLGGPSGSAHARKSPWSWDVGFYFQREDCATFVLGAVHSHHA